MGGGGSRRPEFSWLVLPPLIIKNTAIWAGPHTPVLSGSLPRRGKQRLKHSSKGGELGQKGDARRDCPSGRLQLLLSSAIYMVGQIHKKDTESDFGAET